MNIHQRYSTLHKGQFISIYRCNSTSDTSAKKLHVVNWVRNGSGIMTCRLFEWWLIVNCPPPAIWIVIQKFSFKEMNLKMSSAKQRPFCPVKAVTTPVCPCFYHNTVNTWSVFNWNLRNHGIKVLRQWSASWTFGLLILWTHEDTSFKWKHWIQGIKYLRQRQMALESGCYYKFPCITLHSRDKDADTLLRINA